MAEKACRDGLAPRLSFRRSLAEHVEAGLPDEYLDALEQKRRQLDESIHRYITAKEREYKQFEKDLKQQRDLAGSHDGTYASASKTRRTSSESTQERHGSPKLLAQQSSVVDTLLAAGLRREHIGQPVALAVIDDDGDGPTLEATKATAGLTDRRASTDRNKDFVGVFTPAFLPALDSNDESGAKRSTSSPALNSLEKLKKANQDGQRANSDTAVDALTKRPAQLQLVQRSSSSGSSADGKLTSALKSPTGQPKQRRKRVSLAVGDTIVAPSDNVPVSLSNNSTPSHSRTRTPILERESPSPPSTSEASKSDPQSSDNALSAASSNSLANGTSSSSKHTSTTNSPTLRAAPAVAPPPEMQPTKIDPDGDLFDLEDEEDAASRGVLHEDPFEDEDEVVGRIEPGQEHEDQHKFFDEDAGLITHDGHAEHVEFVPGSAVASQQPTKPGFRRPSVSSDPIYRGANYERAENDAVNNDVYGSSFNKPTVKGSFTAGSLGESFMAQNAERMMRNRAREQTEVRS